MITNSYFVPDDALMTAITSAAQRGVDVTLFNSEASDQFLVSHAERSYYEDLLRAGVKIYQYKAPTLLHSKHITIDDDIAIIGSSNLDIRSFQLEPGGDADLLRRESGRRPAAGRGSQFEQIEASEPGGMGDPFGQGEAV